MHTSQCDLIEFNYEKYDNVTPLWIYGATVGGNIIAQSLRKLGIEPCGFIDRDYTESYFCGLPVIRPVPNALSWDNCIVIVVLTRSFESACKTLFDIGCKTGYTCGKLIFEKDLSLFDLNDNDETLGADFLRKYPYYAKLYSPDAMFHTLEVFITERCNLNCRDCFHLIPYYPKREDHSMDDTIASLDKLLPALGYVYDVNILGGEPLLHRELLRLIQHLKNSNRVEHATIITNGCIVPNDDLIDEIKNSNFCRFRISNYGELSKSLNAIINTCKENGIQCYVSDEPWSDTREIKSYHHSLETLRDILPRCPFGFTYLLIKGRVFRCDRVAHLNRLGFENTADHDSVDVLSDKQTTETIKEDLKRLMGADYLCACEHCGVISAGMIPVERGIQIER